MQWLLLWSKVTLLSDIRLPSWTAFMIYLISDCPAGLPYDLFDIRLPSWTAFMIYLISDCPAGLPLWSIWYQTAQLDCLYDLFDIRLQLDCLYDLSDRLPSWTGFMIHLISDCPAGLLLWYILNCNDTYFKYGNSRESVSRSIWSLFDCAMSWLLRLQLIWCYMHTSVCYQ